MTATRHAPPSMLALVCLMLAGCSGDSGATALPPSSSAPADDTGEVTGTVIDDELQPLPGVTVGLADDPKVKTTTDLFGSFRLQGILPGSHKLLVQKEGYKPETLSVTIIIGEPATAKVTLKPIATLPTRQASFVYDGYIGVDLALPPGNQFQPGAQGASKRSVYYDVEQTNIVGAVSAIQWQSGAPYVSDRMYLILYLNFPPNQCDEAARPHCLPMAAKEGKSPVQAGSNDYQQALADRTDLKINVRFKMRSCVQGDVGPSWADTSRCGSPPEVVQLGVEQRVTAYTTIFYGAPAPDGYKPTPA